MLAKIKPIIKPFWLVFAVFILLHLALFNINFAEWGDSYRILRASEFVRDSGFPLGFDYPDDEKRPPLLSTVLAVRPANVDQVFWGRFVLLLISVAGFFVFARLFDLVAQNLSLGEGLRKRAKLVALLLFTLNPVYLYWSLRIYADVPLFLLILIAFYLFTLWRDRLDVVKSIVLGVVVGLAVLTRFEGYLLFGAIGLGILFVYFRKNLHLSKKILTPLLSYVISFVLTVFPYVYSQNPFSSSYFGETSGREYDVRMFAVYLLSLLFAFGFTSAPYFLFGRRDALLKKGGVVGDFFKQNVGVTAFIIVELLLILAWPAAIPRLFVAIIPLLIIPLGIAIAKAFEKQDTTVKIWHAAILLGWLAVYGVGQKLLHLEFLVSQRYVFFAVILLQLPMIYAVLTKKFRIFIIFLVVSTFIWSFFNIYMHRNIYKSIKQAAEYAQANLQGTIAHNDSGAVTNWYLNYKDKSAPNEGKYFDLEKTVLSWKFLDSNNIDYWIITNEHNTSLDVDLKRRPYLSLVKEFAYEERGKSFFTWVVEVVR